MTNDRHKALPLSEMRFGTMTIAWKHGGEWSQKASLAVALWAQDVASGKAVSTLPQWDARGWIGLNGDAIGGVHWEPLPNGGWDRVDDSGDWFDWLLSHHEGGDEPHYSPLALAVIRDSAPEDRERIAGLVQDGDGAIKVALMQEDFNLRKAAADEADSGGDVASGPDDQRLEPPAAPTADHDAEAATDD